MFLPSLYLQKTMKKYQNFLAKCLKNWCSRMNIKQKVRIKIQQMSIESNFVGVNRLFVWVKSI